MARQSLLSRSVGERLLASKLQLLSGMSSRRPSLALSMLTGRAVQPLTMPVDSSTTGRAQRQFSRRTVYLAERHLRDIDRIIAVWEQVESRRPNRSAVVRRAIAHLRTLVEAEKD
jgi:hypothetical protein